MKIPDETQARMERNTIDIRVEGGNDSRLTGKIVATCIKKMEEQPDLSAEDALIAAIVDEADNDPKIAAQLGMKLGGYEEALSQGQGQAKYLDLQIVGTTNPATPNTSDLKTELATILGDGRVKVSLILSKAENEALDDSLRKHIENTPDIPNPRTIGG